MTHERRRPAGSKRALAATLLAVPLLAGPLLAACAPGTPPATSGRLAVVTTSSVFADLVSQVGGDRVAVTSLVPRNADVHTFEPSPQDVRRVAEARLIVMNGLGLDDWLADLVGNVAPEGTPVVRLAEGLSGADLIEGPARDDGVTGDGGPNPHLWLAVPNAIRYVDRIEAALVDVDPANAAAYGEGGEAYRARLRDLDAWAHGQFEGLPAVSRRIVTLHDAFPYFAREYGLEIVGVAVESPGQEPSAAQVAALIEAIRSAGVRAILSEAQLPAAVVERIAAETGASVVADLYTDSLGDSPVTSYEDLIEWDVTRIVEALR